VHARYVERCNNYGTTTVSHIPHHNAKQHSHRALQHC
jgi:hypothetical protein